MAAQSDPVPDENLVGKDIEADRPPLANAEIAAQRDKINLHRFGLDHPMLVLVL